MTEPKIESLVDHKRNEVVIKYQLGSKKILKRIPMGPGFEKRMEEFKADYKQELKEHLES